MELSTKQKTILIGVLIAIVVVSLVAFAVAAYTMTAPNSDPLNVNPTPTPSPTPSPTPVPIATLSKVTLSASTLYVGEQVTLSTTVSDLTQGMVVNFFNNNNAAVGSATTDSNGVASTSITPPIGTWTYYATATHP